MKPQVLDYETESKVCQNLQEELSGKQYCSLHTD